MPPLLHDSGPARCAELTFRQRAGAALGHVDGAPLKRCRRRRLFRYRREMKSRISRARSYEPIYIDFNY